jgi:hypothetical protein
LVELFVDGFLKFLGLAIGLHEDFAVGEVLCVQVRDGIDLIVEFGGFGGSAALDNGFVGVFVLL